MTGVPAFGIGLLLTLAAELLVFAAIRIRLEIVYDIETRRRDQAYFAAIMAPLSDEEEEAIRKSGGYPCGVGCPCGPPWTDDCR